MKTPYSDYREPPPGLIERTSAKVFGALPAWARVFVAAMTVLLLAWPFFSFGAIFIFDSPVESDIDRLNRYIFALSIWLYPIFYVVCIYLSRRAARLQQSALKIALPFMLPALSPIVVTAEFAWQS